jgi:iron-sulfur cluster assembly protein
MADLINNEAENIEIIPTDIEGASKDDVIKITADAINMINKIKEENEVTEDYLLRLGTRGGGCSGMTYLMGFDSEINDNDNVLQSNSLKLIVDNHSIFYLLGITIDYLQNEEGQGFVFRSPNNYRTCGCHG